MDTNEFYKSIDYSKKVFQKMIQKGGDQYALQQPYYQEEEYNNMPREAITHHNIRNNRNEIMMNELKKININKSNELKKIFNKIYSTFSLKHGLQENKMSLPLVLNENYIDIRRQTFRTLRIFNADFKHKNKASLYSLKSF
jgi:hypothetical protein